MVESTGFIYRVYDRREPNRTRYVGQTIKTVPIRARGHWRDARRLSKYPIHHFLNKRDVEDVVFEAIEEVPVSDLDRREVYWIAHYRSSGEADLNVTDGGSGFRGRKFSEEERKARREAMTGKYRGERHGNHKLTWEDVREIREVRAERWVSEQDLSIEYGVTQSVINKILRNMSWVDDEYDPSSVKPRPAETHANNRQITKELVDEIRQLRTREWVPESEIARRYRLTRSNVNNILRNHRWPDPNYDPAQLVQAGGDGLGSKLTSTQAAEIRSLKGTGLLQREIAEKYGISQTQVSRIFRNVRWRDTNESA